MSKDILYPLRCLHGRLHEANEKRKLRSAYKREFKKNPQTVFLVMTPSHDNLGDHAIVQAEKELLTYFGINCIEITDHQVNEMRWKKHLDILNSFPILITGGGNLGTLWIGIEGTQREIIRKNPKSTIFILPNTIYYENNKWGQEELRNSIQIYNRHKRLTIYAREKISYSFMKPIYRDVRLVPDMVMSLKKDEYGLTRKGCLLCLRSDCEKTRTPEQERIIRRQAQLLFGDQVADTDMAVKRNISADERENALNVKFIEFSEAELVITDRLHGMIFCAITGTSCIVINSRSPKVCGCYEWIKNLNYIRFVNKPEDIAEQYRRIPVGPHHYDNSHLTHYYERLAEDIKDIWR